jgi:hypothetical protein
MRQFLHANYGKGVALHAGLGQAVRSRRTWEGIQRSKAVDLDEVRRFLMLGWTSEAQLQLPSTLGDGAPIGFFNAWAPVQAYYAIYGVMQAWFAANGIGGLTDDHTAALKTMASMIRERNPFPEPWGTLAIGCPMRDERLYLNAPAGHDCAASIELLAVPTSLDGPEQFWPRYGTWLRSTRKARLLRREELWRREHGKSRISKQARTNFANNLAPTSFFDCLWRMRIRANYGSADPFITSYIPESEHRRFHRALTTCIDTTAGMLELYVSRKIGTRSFSLIAEEFLANDGAEIMSTTLKARLSAHKLLGQN